MCNKCEKFHSELFSNHQVFNLDKQIGEIFTGFCKEPNHHQALEFYCKTHNSLCCSACLCKLEKNEIGLHKDCDVCFIQNVFTKIRNEINNKEDELLLEVDKQFDEIYFDDKKM